MKSYILAVFLLLLTKYHVNGANEACENFPGDAAIVFAYAPEKPLYELKQGAQRVLSGIGAFFEELAGGVAGGDAAKVTSSPQATTPKPNFERWGLLVPLTAVEATVTMIKNGKLESPTTINPTDFQLAKAQQSLGGKVIELTNYTTIMSNEWYLIAFTVRLVTKGVVRTCVHHTIARTCRQTVGTCGKTINVGYIPEESYGDVASVAYFVKSLPVDSAQVITKLVPMSLCPEGNTVQVVKAPEAALMPHSITELTVANLTANQEYRIRADLKLKLGDKEVMLVDYLYALPDAVLPKCTGAMSKL